MKKTIPLIRRVYALATTMLIAFSLVPMSAQNAKSLLPVPSKVEVQAESFTLTSQTTIGYTDDTLKPASLYLQQALSRATGYSFPIQSGETSICLTLDPSLTQPSSYRLSIDSRRIRLAGADYKGIIAGIATLRQLLPQEIEAASFQQGVRWQLPAIRVEDAPRFAWRGLMLDVSRHFFQTDEVKQLLDLMACYKLNKFHWHLTDDQGWRIEIKRYPKLTQQGAWRKFNSQDRECLRLAARQDNPDFLLPEKNIQIVQGDTLYGGYYTQDEIREIVAYAAQRGIDVIPEIDMPGHMLAAVSNYKGVACNDQTGWGKMFSSPVCPGKDSAIEFCQNVYKEIFELFPSEYVHIGGDEVEKANWKKCPDCQQRMKENGLQTEEELQAWFTHTMEAFFNRHGKKMIGWDEIIEGGLSPTATVMWWRTWSPQAVPTATAQGNNVIYCPNAQFYLDYQQDKTSVYNIYTYNPILKDMTPAQQSLILGVQGNLWSESIPSQDRMLYMTFPRALALAELGWSQAGLLDWNDFQPRMICHLKRLNVQGVNYRTPDLEGFYDTNAFIRQDTVRITCPDPAAVIRYTTDGTIPTAQSTLYQSPVIIGQSTDFIFRIFRQNGQKGEFFRTRYVKGDYAPATPLSAPATGLEAHWHDFTGSACGNIEQAPFKGTYNIPSVQIPDGVKGNIGLIIKGFIEVPSDGIYTFSLLSDDGSTLRIDGDMVIDNDGAHSPKEKTGQKALKAGYHPIEVRYFDSNGGLLHMQVTDQNGQPLAQPVRYVR